MRKYFVLFSLLAILAACTNNSPKRAGELWYQAQSCAQNGQWQRAQILLDSLHRTYPKQVEWRRQAKILEDSLTYLSQKRTSVYCDSLLQTLLPKADELIREFKYEKNAAYEDNGRYVHRLLATNTNTSRCFLQAYVGENRVTTVKSYYFGNKKVNQSTLTLYAGEDQVVFHGSNHAFQADGWHEIMSMEDSSALALLCFISGHVGEKIRVEGMGELSKNNWVYYLQENERKALEKTYQLGFLMKDIHTLEHHLHKANLQQELYYKRYGKKYEVCDSVKNGVR